MSQARALIAPWENTISSLDVREWNLFGALTNGYPVSFAVFSATREAKPSGALSPVPTAVPPRASSQSGSRDFSRSSTSLSRLDLQPEISCAKVMGVASCRCVLPHLTASAFSPSSFLNVAINVSAAGISFSFTEITAAMCIAVGKVSFELWLIFTSSFG